MLATILTSFKDAIASGYSGTSRPANLLAGALWIDTTNEATVNGSEWSFKIYTGTVDIEVFRLSVSMNGQYGGTVWGDSEFDIQHIAADTAGPILEFIKQRIANNGQILDGDTVAEYRFVGTTNTGSQPTLAFFRWVATDNETTSAYGGTLSFSSTADATSTVAEHLRFIGGQVEFVKPHKLNSARLVAQNVATTGSPIAALDASKRVVEFTGSTATTVQGMNSSQASKVVTIHNRSSASITISHQNVSATAANRFQLPKAADLVITAQGAATFYYCVLDSRWKLRDIPAMAASKTRELDVVRGVTSTWSAPSTVSEINICTVPRCTGMRMGTITGGSGNYSSNLAPSMFVGPSGEMYSWGGQNSSNGQLGQGAANSSSSPVAVLGALRFMPTCSDNQQASEAAAQSTVELDINGAAWAWGINSAGQLGLGDVLPRSSPVAVLGNLKFTSLIRGATTNSGASIYGLTPSGQLYAWGANANGQLGLGDVIPRSSPIAVLGSIQFARVFHGGMNGSTLQVTGLTADGTAYQWGFGSATSPLGVGDILPHSSPIAVLGGLKFTKIAHAVQTFGAGGAFIGLTTSGLAYGWGFSADSLIVKSSSPVAILGGLTFTDIFATTAETRGRCWAITSDGTPYGWGYNADNALGIGSTGGANRSSPIALLGGLKFKKIVPMLGGAFGITSDGTAYAWGGNAQGQLGTGDTVSRSSPVAVLGGLRFEDITVGANFSVMGLTLDGQLYAWGENTPTWELGLGDNVSRSSPVAVLGGLTAASRTSRGDRITMPVTPGANYTVNLGYAGCTFGGVWIGNDIDTITIEYDQ